MFGRDDREIDEEWGEIWLLGSVRHSGSLIQTENEFEGICQRPWMGED
jgi:hypothetical protein